MTKTASDEGAGFDGQRDDSPPGRIGAPHAISLGYSEFKTYELHISGIFH